MSLETRKKRNVERERRKKMGSTVASVRAILGPIVNLSWVPKF